MSRCRRQNIAVNYQSIWSSSHEEIFDYLNHRQRNSVRSFYIGLCCTPDLRRFDQEDGSYNENDKVEGCRYESSLGTEVKGD